MCVSLLGVSAIHAAGGGSILRRDSGSKRLSQRLHYFTSTVHACVSLPTCQPIYGAGRGGSILKGESGRSAPEKRRKNTKSGGGEIHRIVPSIAPIINKDHTVPDYSTQTSTITSIFVEGRTKTLLSNAYQCISTQVCTGYE